MLRYDEAKTTRITKNQIYLGNQNLLNSEIKQTKLINRLYSSQLKLNKQKIISKKHFKKIIYLHYIFEKKRNVGGERESTRSRKTAKP